MRAKISPARRASETPMMSAKQKRFHSSPPGPQKSPPSLSTPSTSMATALIVSKRTPAEFSGAMPLDRGANAAEFLDDWELPLIDALNSVAFCLLPQSDVAHQSRDAVRLQRGRVIGAPHGTIHCDVPLDAAGSKYSRADAGGDPGLMSGIADWYVVTFGHGRYRPQI